MNVFSPLPNASMHSAGDSAVFILVPVVSRSSLLRKEKAHGRTICTYLRIEKFKAEQLISFPFQIPDVPHSRQVFASCPKGHTVLLGQLKSLAFTSEVAEFQ